MATHQHPEPPTGPRALHAPWRLEYLEDLTEKEEAGRSAAPARPTPPPAPAFPDDAASCFMCAAWSEPAHDDPNHVIVRGGAGLIMLNRYPYASGHLLVSLGTGCARLLDYRDAERSRLWRMVDAAADLLETSLQPQGLNIGVNQGRAAGAGVPQHVHVHLVPRWSGDVNFIDVVGRVRIIPSSLEVMASRLREGWTLVSARWPDL